MSSCSICLSEAIPKSQSITTSCSHTFCNPCLTKWLLMHTSCPLCRGSLGADEERRSLSVLIGFGRLRGMGLDIHQCLRRVNSLAHALFLEGRRGRAHVVLPKPIRRNDTQYTIHVDVHSSTLWNIWATKYYLTKPKPVNKWQTNPKRKRRIRRTGKKCRG